MKRLSFLLVSLAAVLALAFAGSASASSGWALRIGAHGQRVRDAQWLMQGHNVFKLRTFPFPLSGRYGKRTRHATHMAKYWLGYPPNRIDGVYGPVLRAYLAGERPLPSINAERRRQRQATLRVGDRGRRVRDLQWLLAGNKPSAYRIRTYRGPINGVYGRATWRAVKKMKWRLGWPKAAINGQAAPKFIRILMGVEPRPIEYIAIASKRVRAARAKTNCDARTVRLANSQVGVTEYPYGSNRGRMVDQYERIAPGMVGVAWCASFAQWVLYHSGAGTVAGRTGYVFGIVSYARRRGWLHARPKPGALVAYLWSEGHIGVVTGTGRSGYTSVEGNWSNRVSRVWHPYGYRGTVFIWVPCRGAGVRYGLGDRSGFPLWLVLVIFTASAATATAGGRAMSKRAARRLAHEVGEVADTVERKLED